ncbi:NUDIX hydrolase [Planococcus sp. A6]|uniref:NUDIX hydrolase n=1 Tax=Planococcus sp. A6 TaxID=2992760 RepID=UPI00237AE14A|nr:NUDIX hydrolase [Planococcus sp. A6]MDE0581687.1 NUDIX hydrolase [Planococcus sp. A6]
MKTWETLSTEYLYKNPFGNLRKEQCRLPNGIVIDNFYINEYPDWVNAVVLTDRNQLVFVKQYRHGTRGFYLEIPAGKLEENETSEQGILREVHEETGFTSNENPILLGEHMVNPAVQNNKISTYLITSAFKTSDQKLDDTEEIDVKLIDFEEFGDLIMNRAIETQLFTASAYYMAKSFLKK